MRVRLEKDALVESYGTRRFVYGRWDAIFQFWIWEKDAPPRQWLPKWPVINPAGDLDFTRFYLSWDSGNLTEEDIEWYFHPDNENGYYDDHQDMRKMHQMVLDQFQDYVRLIPSETRKLAGQFQRWQWAILKAIKMVPGFEGFLKTELANRTPHFIQACLEYGYETSQREQNGFQNLIHRIMHQKRDSLLSRISGKDWPKSGLSMIEKIHPAPTKKNLELLHAVISNTNKAAVLSRFSIIPLNLLMWWDRIDDALIQPATIPFFNDPRVTRRTSELSEALALHGSAKDEKAVRQSFSTVGSPEDVLDRCEKFMVKIVIGSAPYPPSPLKGSKWLRPITSRRGLKKEGREMQNCVGGYELLLEVLRGRSFFYRWFGRERVTVELVKTSQNSWELGQVEGRGNCPVSRNTRAQIQTEVNRQDPAPALSRPWPWGPR